jgi:hypothetical protein
MTASGYGTPHSNACNRTSALGRLRQSAVTTTESGQSLMKQDSITEVSIDSQGRLHVRPASASFPHVWRAAMEVYWEESSRTLYSPTPREWTYGDWFRQILAAAKDEYGFKLELTASTKWIDVPPDTIQVLDAISRAFE